MEKELDIIQVDRVFAWYFQIEEQSWFQCVELQHSIQNAAEVDKRLCNA